MNDDVQSDDSQTLATRREALSMSAAVGSAALLSNVSAERVLAQSGGPDDEIRGTVEDSGGVVEGATVVAVPHDKSLDPLVTMTDASGEYVFEQSDLYEDSNLYHVIARDGTESNPRRGEQNYPFIAAQGPAAIPDSENLQLRFDATELNLNGGETVDPWPDIVGSNDANAVGGPTYQTGQQNGNPWVLLDGTDDGFALSNRINELHNGSDWSLYLAWQRLDTGDQYIFGSGGYQSTDLGGGLLHLSDDDAHDRISDGSNWINSDQPDGYAGVGSFGVTSRVHSSGDSLDGWQDGISVYSTSISGSYGSGDSDYLPHIGVRYYDQGSPLNAGLGEILFYEASHSSSTRAEAESYLADKWGVTL